ALAFVVCEAPSAGHAAPALQTLYSFGGGNDGAFPESALIADQIDTLYGTTFAGGSVDEGTIFKLTPPATPGGAWTESVLSSFSQQGSLPLNGLISNAVTNALYGTTSSISDFSTVFSLTLAASV